MTPKKFSDEIELEICSAYLSGYTIQVIADTFSASCTAVHNVLIRNNIRRRNTSDYDIRMYHCDDNFFDEIDTEEKAYWLGFLEADGCIMKEKRGYRMQFRLTRKDKNSVEKFKKNLQTDNPIVDGKQFDKRTNKFYFFSRIRISSKQLTKSLLKHKKNIYSTVPNKLKHHFIRGLFDGDGGVDSSGLFAIRGKPLVITMVQKYLMKELNLNKTKFDKEYDEAWRMRYNGRVQFQRIYDFLYKDATVWMERKRDRFLEILST